MCKCLIIYIYIGNIEKIEIMMIIKSPRTGCPTPTRIIIIEGVASNSLSRTNGLSHFTKHQTITVRPQNKFHC